MKKNIHVLMAMFGLAICLLSNTIIAQSTNPASTSGNDFITITGKVVSIKDNQPLSNVSVKILKAKGGTISTEDGSFTIKVKKGDALLFSRVDLIAQNVSVFDPKMTIVKMQEAENNLSDVLVLAYSNQKRSSFTGAVSTVKNAVIESAPNASVQESIQGNIAGVQSTNASGQPGSVPNIRVRGIGSINAGSAPLYVIDGIPVVSGDISGMNSNTIAGLNANDVETMSILKDAAATSLYGSRAANGVVLITTKKGKSGKSKIHFTYQNGTNNNTIREEQKNIEYSSIPSIL